MELIGLMFLEVALVLGAIVGGAILAIIVAVATRGALRGRPSSIIITFLSPILILLYLEASVVIYGFGERAAGKDNFLDGQYHYSLTNGYRLSMFDKFPDDFYIESTANPRAEGVNNVKVVQVAGNFLLVSAYRADDISDSGEGKVANRYLEVNTKNLGVTDFRTSDALRSDAAEKGIVLRLIPAADLLNLNEAKSLDWPEVVYFVLLVIPPAVVIRMFIREVRRVRTTIPEHSKEGHEN